MAHLATELHPAAGCLVGQDWSQKAGDTGGHAFALVGYNERGFVVQNSWGTDWGASGFAILRYEDWVTNGTDAWAVALGVPQDLSDIQSRQASGAKRVKPGKTAQAASGFRVMAGRGLSDVGATLRVPDNPRDDPWPFNHVFGHRPYQPLRTDVAAEVSTRCRLHVPPASGLRPATATRRASWKSMWIRTRASSPCSSIAASTTSAP